MVVHQVFLSSNISILSVALSTDTCIISFTSCFSESESLLGLVTIIAGHNSGVLSHAGPLIHLSFACKLTPPQLPMSAGFSSEGIYFQIYPFSLIFLTLFDTNCL